MYFYFKKIIVTENLQGYRTHTHTKKKNPAYEFEILNTFSLILICLETKTQQKTEDNGKYGNESQ